MGFKYKIKKFLHKFLVDINYQLSLIALILIVGAIFVWFGVWFNFNNKLSNATVLSDGNTNTKIVSILNEEKVFRKTDGMPVEQGKENDQSIAVMIENLASENVRPQYGLQKAEIVYEMPVEGGITRFMAIYSNLDDIKQIGPVRSVRPTFLEFSSEYNAILTHAGGSPEALSAISGLQIQDCSALSADSKYFWRYSNNYAPHNLMTSSELLSYALRDKQLNETDSSFDSWLFEDLQINNKKPEAEKYIKISFSTPEYEATWKYDNINDQYKRYYQENEHKDALTDSAITAKNIIIQVVPPAMDAGEKGRVNFDVNGEGKAYIFKHGEKIDGTWKKNGRTERTKFYNADNQEIPLVRGNVWIEVLPSDKVFENN
jgi:hypothetical protein